MSDQPVTDNPAPRDYDEEFFTWYHLCPACGGLLGHNPDTCRDCAEYVSDEFDDA